jgi:saccharopine dehydrogenase-like NADP-dependent oxidoreductase
MIKRPAVIGMGVVGDLVATMLRLYGLEAIGVDKEDVKAVAPIRKGDIQDKDFLEEATRDCDAIVCCLPYHLTKGIVEFAYEKDKHYFDATEDVATTELIRSLGRTAKKVMIPQCGLAPGFIGIATADLTSQFKEVHDIRMRVGALPKNPSGKLGYAVNWSIEGLVNECIEDCDIIKDRKPQKVPALALLETIRIGGTEYEAFTTSGGLGTMVETYKGMANNLDYKTIRYPGHCEMMSFLLNEMKLRDKRWELMSMLKEAVPPCEQDKVIVHASVTGEKNGAVQTIDYVREYGPKTINGRSYKAIAWTTAAAIVSVVQMVSQKYLPQKGFVKQEDIPYDKFVWMTYGKLFNEDEEKSDASI